MTIVLSDLKEVNSSIKFLPVCYGDKLSLPSFIAGSWICPRQQNWGESGDAVREVG